MAMDRPTTGHFRLSRLPPLRPSLIINLAALSAAGPDALVAGPELPGPARARSGLGDVRPQPGRCTRRRSRS